MKWILPFLLIGFASPCYSAVFGPRNLDRVQDEGTDLSKRKKINFIGSSISCVDNSDNSRTNCTLSPAIVTATATFTADANDLVILSSATAASFTINLPAAADVSGQVYHIKKIDSSANTITVDANGSETIDGATTAVLTTQYESIQIVCDGTEWWIL